MIVFVAASPRLAPIAVAAPADSQAGGFERWPIRFDDCGAVVGEDLGVDVQEHLHP